jgi:hypothetical protein
MKKLSLSLNATFDMAVVIIRLLLLSLFGAGFWGSIYLLIFKDIPMLISLGGLILFATGFIMRLKMLFGQVIDRNGIEMRIALGGAIIAVIGFFQIFL